MPRTISDDQAREITYLLGLFHKVVSIVEPSFELRWRIEQACKALEVSTYTEDEPDWGSGHAAL